MTGQVQAGGLLFQRQQLFFAHLGQIGHGDLLVLHVLNAHTEQVKLSLNVLAPFIGDCVHHPLVYSQHLAAVEAHGVKRTRLNHALQCTAVQVLIIQALAEIHERRIRAVRLSFLDQLAHKGTSDVLDRSQAKADIRAGYRETVLRAVDIGRQNTNAHLLGLGNVLRDLTRHVKYRGQQRCQIFTRIVTFQISGAVGYDRVAHRMRLVEGVVCKVHDLVKDLCCGLLGHTACDRAINALVRIAVNEAHALLFQLLELLLTHRAAHHICLAQ